MAKIVTDELTTPVQEAVVEVVSENSSLITPKRVAIVAGVTLAVVGGVWLARKFRKHAEEVESETDKD